VCLIPWGDTGTADQSALTTFTAISMTNCAAGRPMWFQLEWIGADAGDNYAATAEVLTLQIEGRTIT